MNEQWINALSNPEDHVHVVMKTMPKGSVAEVVQMLKGGTSRAIRNEFSELEEFFRGDRFSADSCFAETGGNVHENVHEEVVKRYI